MSSATELQCQIFANRVKKTYRHLARRFERQGIAVFRLYDRDIPELRLVVDWYDGHLLVGEYARLQTASDPDWLPTLANAAAEALAVPAERLHLRTRQTRPQDGGQRYQRQGHSGARFVVRERDLRFWVNLDDYLDTGLFSDHRDTRALVRQAAQDQRVLNLFAYTGAFTCAAAAGGAAQTTSVDASRTYLDWARDNLELNRLLRPEHELVRAEVADFIARSSAQRRTWQLVVLDPPSYSDKGRGFDVLRDHRRLVQATLGLLAPGGLLYFSTNHQRFVPELDGLDGVEQCVELTARTVPEDYRNRQAHRCFQLRRSFHL